MPLCVAAAADIRKMKSPIDLEVLVCSFRAAHQVLGRMRRESVDGSLGFEVLVCSGLLEAIADVGLRAMHQAHGFKAVFDVSAGPNMERVLGSVLGKETMGRYKTFSCAGGRLINPNVFSGGDNCLSVIVAP